jgi:hypothetical protein
MWRGCPLPSRQNCGQSSYPAASSSAPTGRKVVKPEPHRAPYPLRPGSSGGRDTDGKTSHQPCLTRERLPNVVGIDSAGRRCPCSVFRPRSSLRCSRLSKRPAEPSASFGGCPIHGGLPHCSFVRTLRLPTTSWSGRSACGLVGSIATIKVESCTATSTSAARSSGCIAS